MREVNRSFQKSRESNLCGNEDCRTLPTVPTRKTQSKDGRDEEDHLWRDLKVQKQPHDPKNMIESLNRFREI
jgi:hypothetical protein